MEKLTMDLKGMSAGDAQRLMGWLVSGGYRADEHWEALYGAGWVTIGVRVTGASAIRYAMHCVVTNRVVLS